MSDLKVLSVSIDENNMIPFVTQQLQNPDLALRLAVRCDLPGQCDFLHSRFEQEICLFIVLSFN